MFRGISGNFQLLLCAATNQQTKWWQMTANLKAEKSNVNT